MAFKLNLYTPSGVVVKNIECDDLTIPTVRGQINILKDHTHILTELSTGVIVAKGKMGSRHFVVTAGLCKILNDQVIILANTSESADKIDLERAKAAEMKAQSILGGKDPLSDVQVIKFQRKLARAKARIQAANSK
jgi:F-type H+-transporting ATPase subunit epsilon